ncbi:DUF4843 domain-containing protein [Pinibacter soli]|uniref:DUF4843 domain-containing protein n=1 Tax=Pinibacter soli TaxID=3044211 RepID=A0ABT6RG93_9BACT|nr:DUF4843 domain-containing protein [Pinibacter soli]MDI3321481.1 DUF4843 domain-containing protein [Pinibacter soli]
MKRIYITTILLAIAAGFAACKQESPTMFTENDAIYFSAASDSIGYSFAKYPSRVVDTIKVPVTVLGSPVNADREIVVQSIKDSAINAVEGVHYKLLTPYKMPANQVTTQLPVVIYRTPDLDSLTATFVLSLQVNNNFKLGFAQKSRIKLKTAYLQKPSSWGETNGTQWAGNISNFGTWTRTKYKMILAALYDPIGDSTITEFPYPKSSAPVIYGQYLQLVRNYIRTNYPGNVSSPVGVGATLRDPDANNAVVLVGNANY